MTLQTCKTRLELAKKRGNAEEIAMWEDRIKRKLTKPKYANLKPEPVPTKSTGKK